MPDKSIGFLVRCCIVSAVIVALLLGGMLYRAHFFDRNVHPISIDEAYTLLRAQIAIPQPEQIVSLDTYDDRFLEPEVRVRYANGMRLSITRSHIIYPDALHSQETIGSLSIDKYSFKDKVPVYQFLLPNGIYYSLSGEIPYQIMRDPILGMIDHP